MKCGVDIVKIERIQKIMENSRFLERCFNSDELEMFAEKKYHPQTVAANFAAKEALYKAYGTGIGEHELLEVSVLRDERGAPYFVFKKEAHNASVSLSHDGEYAVAFVILEDE